ncbi:MerR family transcriptional regulator [Paramicrobacterium agarici]|uniref:MerR family gold-responsive transcriptional activator of gol and ges genes n=1 Tax=Paramicrobacterium agarici TaxID=630514 RepID=A0A2A9DTG3_9MICO|nr:MerR family transcriptional regulator [Microbacterium agarici]PFG29435.1 MerR family gold-responsive transcriptional activator of gol and ges genes [Microbacterium agarici]
MKIAEAAARLGVETHVLRHWEDMKLVVPERTAAGHREYSEEHVRRLQIVQACRGVGVSLREIRHVLHRGEQGRDAVIDRRLAAIRRQREELDAAELFLRHVRQCRHSLITRCPECSAYALRR